MVIIPSMRTVVLQPPRTGSTSLRNALMLNFPDAVNPHRHMERTGIPEEYSEYDVVGIVRNPVVRLYSLYKYMKSCIDEPHHDKSRRMWSARQRFDADRPFEEWLLNSTETFSDLDITGACDNEYYRTDDPRPAARKSQYDFMRPDLGYVELIKLESNSVGRRFGIALPHLNSTLPRKGQIHLSDAIRQFLLRHHKWDMELYELCTTAKFSVPA